LTINPLKAKLYVKGQKVNIYALESHNECEIMDFFENNRNNKQFNIPGFIKIIQTIADQGFIFQTQIFKSWTEQNELISEIKKGDYRISCFKYGNGKKLLLVTCFNKTRDKEKKEYLRAINLKKKFDNNLIWIDDQEED
jgi:hypothetical protein